jgi:hypothetical protein
MIDDAYLTTVQDVSFYRINVFDEYPNLIQAIFTRAGGVSQPPFNSLNMGWSVGDNPQAVKQNYQLACRAVQVTLSQTVTCHQIHEADILTIDSISNFDDTNQQAIAGQADGLVTGKVGIYLMMRFADCTPLLFFDPVQEAVGLAHAGWRGTMHNVAGATVQAMKSVGCLPENIMAVIGPSIGPCCYEVGPDVIEAVAQQFDDSATLFTFQSTSAYFNMWEANCRQLVRSGVKQIIQTKLCTACHTDKFFSHRAEKGRTGRFGAIIGLNVGATGL